MLDRRSSFLGPTRSWARAAPLSSAPPQCCKPRGQHRQLHDTTHELQQRYRAVKSSRRALHARHPGWAHRQAHQASCGRFARIVEIVKFDQGPLQQDDGIPAAATAANAAAARLCRRRLHITCRAMAAAAADPHPTAPVRRKQVCNQLCAEQQEGNASRLPATAS